MEASLVHRYEALKMFLEFISQSNPLSEEDCNVSCLKGMG